MGNTASVEEGRRPTHKLAKPRVGNHETNTLLSPIGLPDPRRRFSASRTTSLPYGTTPASSPIFPSPESTIEILPDQKDEQTDRKPRSRSISRAATSLFRSRSSQATQNPRGRQNSVGMQTPSQSTRPSRANSMIIGGTESQYAQSNVAVWNTPVRPSVGSRRTSVTYDLNSYEAKRLLNLVEEPAYEKNSVTSESKFQAVSLTRRDSIQSPFGDKAATTNIGRVNSDVSLYVPMRRKSLIATPGVATRTPAPAPAVPSIPTTLRKSNARFSLPATPARRDSLDSMTVGMLTIPPPSINPDSMPRAVTPCEEDYGHIGAFKIGSLRITNGSPAISPAVETPMEMLPFFRGRTERNDYFANGQVKPSENAPTLRLVTANTERPVENSQFLDPLVISQQGSDTTTVSTLPQYLPDVHLSPVEMGNRSETDACGLLTTSKHTALEDDLFEDDHTEYSQSETLDIRVDLSAKSLPPRPRLISEGRTPREMMRSDSGVVGTPILEELPQGTLAKSDSGYSSNVSLRSFSTRPSLAEKECSVADAEFPPQTPVKDILPAVYESPADSQLSGSRIISSENDDHVPPPVPEKQSAVKDIKSKDLPPSFPRGSEATQFGRVSQESGILVQDAQNKTNDISYASRQPLPNPESPTTNQLGLSDGNGSRKPGKFGRLLHSARKPLTGQTTQRSDKSNTPSRPKGKPNERGNSFSLSVKRLGFKAEHSKVTAEPVADNVSELEDEGVPPVPKIPRIVADAEANSISDASFWSADAPLTSTSIGMMSCRTAITRKPLPIRKDSSEGPQVKTDIARGNHAYPELQHLKLGFEDVTVNVAHSIPLLDEPLAEQMRRTKSPPVSMKTRTLGSSQKKPPLRAQSTPPTANQSAGTASLVRRHSREDVYSYPSVQSLSRKKPSRENIYSYPPAEAVYESLDRRLASPNPRNTDRQCSVSIKTKDREHRLPNWEVQTDHGTPTQPSFVNNSRGGSPANQTGHDNARSLELQPHIELQKPVRPSAPRHQSSYDGYSYEQVQAAAEAAAQKFHEESWYQDNGRFPSLQHSDGRAHVADPWSDQPMPQASDQQARFPPYVPRGHARTYSLGSHGEKAPFRVLHSYNSPAYKNAPIWG